MNAQKPIRSVKDFVECLVLDNISRLPCNNDAQSLARQSRQGRRTPRRLKAKNLFKRNVRSEANRLNLFNQYLINSSVNELWYFHLTPAQRDQFIDLARRANDINETYFPPRVRLNNSEIIDRIARITTIQITEDSSNNNFYNGTTFSERSNFETLLPTGWSFDPSSLY